MHRELAQYLTGAAARSPSESLRHHTRLPYKKEQLASYPRRLAAISAPIRRRSSGLNKGRAAG